MDEFQYFLLKNCAIERDLSMIASDDSFDCDFAKWGLTYNLIEIPHEIEFNLIHQVSLNVGADICGILGDVNGDSGTIRSNLSDATLTTSQSVLPKPVNYLVPIQTPVSPSNNSSAPASTEENRTVLTVTMNVPSSPENAQDSLIPPAANLQ